jgi:hypothetical protein
MKIQVDRTNTPEGNLIFTITVSEPHHSSFGEIEKNIMGVLDFCKEGVQNLSPEDNKVRNDVIGLIHNAKEKTFMRVLDNLKFAIENEFRPKFKPICQEIYNWIYDNQTDVLKKWMSEFDPQRTKYYFDNDITPNKFQQMQESEHDEDDDEDDEDDE